MGKKRGLRTGRQRGRRRNGQASHHEGQLTEPNQAMKTLSNSRVEGAWSVSRLCVQPSAKKPTQQTQRAANHTRAHKGALTVSTLGTMHSHSQPRVRRPQLKGQRIEVENGKVLLIYYTGSAT